MVTVAVFRRVVKHYSPLMLNMLKIFEPEIIRVYTAYSLVSFKTVS